MSVLSLPVGSEGCRMSVSCDSWLTSFPELMGSRWDDRSCGEGLCGIGPGDTWGEFELPSVAMLKVAVVTSGWVDWVWGVPWLESRGLESWGVSDINECIKSEIVFFGE